MNLSALFIKRPVTTTLIVLGIIVFGAMSYRLLPVSDLPTVDFPTIQVERRPAGRQPGDDGVGRRAAARKTVRDDRRTEFDQFDERTGQHVHHAAVRSEPEHRRGRAGRPGDDRQDRAPAAAADAGAAVVPEGQSRRSAGAVPGAALADAAVVADRRVRRIDNCAAHLDGERRRAGERVRRREVRGADRRRSAQARGARPGHRRSRQLDHQREREPADGNDVRRGQDVRRAGQRSAAPRQAYGPTIITYRNGNPVD